MSIGQKDALEYIQCLFATSYIAVILFIRLPSSRVDVLNTDRLLVENNPESLASDLCCESGDQGRPAGSLLANSSSRPARFYAEHPRRKLL